MTNKKKIWISCTYDENYENYMNNKQFKKIYSLSGNSQKYNFEKS